MENPLGCTECFNMLQPDVLEAIHARDALCAESAALLAAAEEEEAAAAAAQRAAAV